MYKIINNNAKVFVRKLDTPCIYCARKTANCNGATLDHIIPKSLGGTNNNRNLVNCCKLCNDFKANKLPQQWLDQVNEMMEDKIPIRKGFDKSSLGQIRKSIKNIINTIDINLLIK